MKGLLEQIWLVPNRFYLRVEDCVGERMLEVTKDMQRVALDNSMFSFCYKTGQAFAEPSHACCYVACVM